jgi:methionine sulfoxide reductase heme-binding subunit
LIDSPIAFTGSQVLRIVLNNKSLFGAVLAIPAALMLVGLSRGAVPPVDLLHPTGETSARLMIIAMMIAPLIALVGPRGWLRWLLARRRALGVAAFAYALLHLVLYMVDMGVLADMLAEFTAPGIWTGWAAFVLMIPLALTSNDASMRALKSGWKRLQRLAYPAALLTLLHWIFVHNNLVAALVHFVPLMLLLFLRSVRSPRPTLQGSKP